MTEVGNQSASSLCLCLCLFFQICARCRRCLRFPIPFPTCLAVLLFRTFNKEREKESFIEIKKPRLLDQAYHAMRARRIPRAERVRVRAKERAKNAEAANGNYSRCVPFLREDFKYSFLFLSLSLSLGLSGFFFTTPSLSATHSSEWFDVHSFPRLRAQISSRARTDADTR